MNASNMDSKKVVPLIALALSDCPELKNLNAETLKNRAQTFVDGVLNEAGYCEQLAEQSWRPWHDKEAA